MTALGVCSLSWGLLAGTAGATVWALVYRPSYLFERVVVAVLVLACVVGLGAGVATAVECEVASEVAP